jgi:hypothetical protein
MDARTELRAKGEFAAAVRLDRWRAALGVPVDVADAPPMGDLPPALAGLNIMEDVEAASARGVADAVAAVPFDLPNQRVVTIDVQRTRGEVPELRREEEQLALRQLLTHFCRGGYAWRPPRRRHRAGDALVVRDGSGGGAGGSGAGAAPAAPPAPVAVPPVGYKQVSASLPVQAAGGSVWRAGRRGGGRWGRR